MTSRARNKIKHLIQAEEKTRSLELGRKLFDKEARRFGLNVTQAHSKASASPRCSASSGLQKADELFAAIGYGKLAAKAVLAKLVPQEQLKEPRAGERGLLGRAPRARHAARTRSRCAASTI